MNRPTMDWKAVEGIAALIGIPVGLKVAPAINADTCPIKTNVCHSSGKSEGVQIFFGVVYRVPGQTAPSLAATNRSTCPTCRQFSHWKHMTFEIYSPGECFLRDRGR